MRSKTVLSVVSLVVAAGLAGCRSNNAGGELPILDVEAAIDNQRTFDLSEITSEIEFIALDGSSEGSLVGNISRMRESRDRFYIYQDMSNPVKVFDKTGRFLSTRGLVGRGPNELPMILDVAVDYQRDNVYLKGGSTTIAAYDSEGNLFARNDSIVQSAAITSVDDKLLVLKGRVEDTHEPGGEKTLIEIFSADLQREGGVDVFDNGRSELLPVGGFLSIFINGTMSDSGNSVLVKEAFSDTLFHYRIGRALEPVYRLHMGRHAIPDGATGNNPTVQWGDLHRHVREILEGDRYILVLAMNYIPNAMSVDRVFLDKHDPAGGFSPLGPDGKPGLFLGGVAFMPCYIRDNRLVGYMQAIDIVDNAAAITNPDLKTLAATLREDSNPVIVVAELKR